MINLVQLLGVDKLSENEKQSYAWLGSRCEPWSEVERHWILTFNFRTQMLKNKDFTIADIYEKWPILKQNGGYTLV